MYFSCFYLISLIMTSFTSQAAQSGDSRSPALNAGAHSIAEISGQSSGSVAAAGSVTQLYVSDEEMDAMDETDNFHLPRPHALSTSVSIHDAFRACVSRPPLVCSVCDEIHFLQPHNSTSTFGPGGAARWHHMIGAELLQFRSILSQQPGVPALLPAVVNHYQLHSSVRLILPL